MRQSLHKFFTPSICAEERDDIFLSFGLGGLSFQFVEMYGEQLLSAVRVEGLHRTPLIGLQAPRDLRRRDATDLPVVWLDHSKRVPSQGDRKSLFEEIFPKPFGFLGRGGFGTHVGAWPDEISVQISRFLSALEHLESAFALGELGILWLCSPTHAFALVAHYVRSRRIRVGTQKEIERLCRAWGAGSLSERSLAEELGTRVVFLPLSVSELRGFESFDSMTKELLKSLSRTGMCSVI